MLVDCSFDIDRLATTVLRLSLAAPCESASLSHSPSACQAKVTDLEVTVGVDQQVAGLEVSVQHVGTVHVLQPTQHLCTHSEDKPNTPMVLGGPEAAGSLLLLVVLLQPAAPAPA